jgi:hypothetical protein
LTHARLSLPATIAIATGAVAVLGGAAALAMHVLHGTSAPDATTGVSELGTTAPASPATPATAQRHGLDARYLALDKTELSTAKDATSPAAFERMLAADGPGWAAADGTISVPLDGGRTLWLFGDTLMDLPNPDGTIRRNADFIRNSAILQDGGTATTLATGTARDAGDFLTPTRAGEWYWPGAGVQQGSDVVLFMQRMHQTATGAQGWNFASRGTDLVRLDTKTLAVRDTTAVPSSANTDWGTALASDAQHTYVYGMRTGDGPFDRFAVVARAPKGQVGDAPFEYWDGKRWQGDETKAAPLANGLSNQYSVLRTPDGKWAMVSQQLFFGTALNARTADHPQGPWSDWHEIDPGPKQAPGTISYNAQVHPSLGADGKLLVSWNMNRSDAQLPTEATIGTYRPQFRAVEASRLDQ